MRKIKEILRDKDFSGWNLNFKAFGCGVVACRGAFNATGMVYSMKLEHRSQSDWNGAFNRLEYTGRVEGLVFVTRNGKRYVPDQILRAFKKAAKTAGLTKNISPHSLRVTAITLFIEKGYGSDQVIKVSGHADARIVKYYDKSGKVDNLTREMCLI